MSFTGFPRPARHLLARLGANNNREWFQAHSERAPPVVVEPARQFVCQMAMLLPELGENLHAEPKVRGSIFTINRDIRFSRDKSPNKTYQDLWFWQGNGPSRECPGYFLRLEADALTIGAGMQAFSDTALTRFRASLTDDSLRQALHAALSQVQPDYDVGGQTLKRVPAGFHTDDLARHTALVRLHHHAGLPDAVFNESLPEWCMAHFRRLAPLQQWLTRVYHRSPAADHAGHHRAHRRRDPGLPGGARAARGRAVCANGLLFVLDPIGGPFAVIGLGIAEGGALLTVIVLTRVIDKRPCGVAGPGAPAHARAQAVRGTAVGALMMGFIVFVWFTLINGAVWSVNDDLTRALVAVVAGDRLRHPGAEPKRSCSAATC